MPWFFFFFLLSGFCSILYEIVWLRIAMAQFGVTTAMVSLVLSAFMVGLGLGTWGGGVLVRKYAPVRALSLYALLELLIGGSAIAVPHQLFWGRQILLRALHDFSLSSPMFYLAAGVWLGLTLVPWCMCMGATFPFAMAAMRQNPGANLARSFSYLYLANVLGATAGTVVPLLLVELFGFRRTLETGSVINLLLAASAFCLSLRQQSSSAKDDVDNSSSTRNAANAGLLSQNSLLWLLFGSGLTSMGAEVIWVRLYTPSLTTVVYAFAAILGIYLIAVDFGSWCYRRWNRGDILDTGLIWPVLGVFVLVAFLFADPRIQVPPLFRVFLGIAPFSCVVGFITPAVVDRFSQGDAERAGTAYAVNILGCVLGPLVAGFVLLPWVGERLSLGLLALPWFAAGLKYRPESVSWFRQLLRSRYGLSFAALSLASLLLIFSSEGFEEQYQPRQVRRDNTATVVATGHGRRDDQLLVNGVGMTMMINPIPKMMAHLPNAFLPRPPRNALIICFGMGTTHLSMLSWGIHSTSVELVPSVPELITFFHPNAKLLMDSPLSSVVIDDGRSYLERSSEEYDVITIDPPPPPEAAGSSLLYSKEFYAAAKSHLKPDGILQQWLPYGDADVVASITRALKESFEDVRVFHGLDGTGFHFLCSMKPLPRLSASELAEKLPPAAARDLVEWGPAADPKEQFGIELRSELSADALIGQAPSTPALQDDLPINEYFMLRSLRASGFDHGLLQSRLP